MESQVTRILLLDPECTFRPVSPPRLGRDHPPSTFLETIDVTAVTLAETEREAMIS